MPDSFLAKAVAQGESSTSVDTLEQKYGNLLPGDMTPGFHTPAGDIDMKKIGQVGRCILSGAKSLV